MTPQLLSVEQSAAILGVKEQTIRKWLSLGRIGFVKIGRRTLIEQQTITQMIESGRRPAIPA